MLSPRQLARAMLLNPVMQAKLGWQIPFGWPSDPSTAAFAELVAKNQSMMQLTIDGVFGAKTQAALAGKTFDPNAGRALIVNGKEVLVDFPVVTFRQPEGLSFHISAAAESWRPRRAEAKPEVFVLHWDGCTSSHQCYQVLLERKLSVHLMLDKDGVLYQGLDLAAAKAYHAGAVNERSVGMEICNPVTPNRLKYDPKRKLVKDRGVNGDHDKEHLDFFDPQKELTVKIADVLQQLFAFPRVLPRVPTWPSVWDGDDSDPPGTVARGMLANVHGFRGVCGHYHVSDTKDDPGQTLWPAFSAAGWG